MNKSYYRNFIKAYNNSYFYAQSSCLFISLSINSWILLFFPINSRYKLACVISYAFLMHVARHSMKWTCRGGMPIASFLYALPITQQNPIDLLILSRPTMPWWTLHIRIVYIFASKSWLLLAGGVSTPPTPMIG